MRVQVFAWSAPCGLAAALGVTDRFAAEDPCSPLSLTMRNGSCGHEDSPGTGALVAAKRTSEPQPRRCPMPRESPTISPNPDHRPGWFVHLLVTVGGLLLSAYLAGMGWFGPLFGILTGWLVVGVAMATLT